MNSYMKLLCGAPAEFADNIAIIDRNGERATTYKAFGDLMARTAAYIRKQNLGERRYIPVRFESSVEFAAAVCGVWLSGNIAVPMGASFPEERVKYISVNCEAPFIIDDSALPEIMKTEPMDISEYPNTQDEDEAILIYTSGSTGMPKGIIHTFEGLYANRMMGNPPLYSTGQVWAMGAPLYFVASIAVYKVLTYGGCVHLLSQEVMRDAKKLEDYYEKHSVTVGFISPSLLQNFHNRSESLKVVLTGSERLTGQCSRDGYELYNNYGMSETMGTICTFLVEKSYDTTPVGIPKEGVTWALFDEDMNPVPDGQEGELCVKGPYTRGYFKNEEATRKLFRGGWLHTGDILKKLPDGNLVYINRKDWMVKINGQRVEPGEIENVMREIPGIEGAVVKAIKAKDSQIRLCAYYTGSALQDDDIRDALEKKLAAYMIPSFYLRLDEFPINQNGKIDRKNLPEPDLNKKLAEYVPPRDDTEAMLCRAFEKALEVDRVGINDDFFSLGGDSIRVMKLANLCPELDLTSKLIYSEKTPGKIAEGLKSTGTVRERLKKDSYPLSSSQLGIFIESMNRDGEALYNNPILFKLPNDIDADRLREAAEAVVCAHPFIKMRISLDENENPVQNRNEEEKYTQTVEELEQKEFDELIPSLIRPFRLLKDRLFRIRIFKTEEHKYLFLDFHHIIFDGSSMQVLMRDLEKAYQGESLEKETYSGFEAAEDESLVEKERYEEAKAWYLSTFGGIEGDFLPIPDRRQKETRFSALEMELMVEAKEAEALCRRADVTENILATAAFGICLGLYAGMNEALFSTIYNGRESLRTARTISMLVKTLPVYTRFEKDEDITGFLREAKEQMLGCMANDIYPYSQLVSETHMISDPLFVYQGDALKVGSFAGGDIEYIPIMENATGHQLSVQVYKGGGLYNIRAEYRSDLYSDEFIRTFLESYETVLKKMLESEKIGDVSLCSDNAIRQLRQWNDTDRDYDASQTVVSLFEKAAAAYPDNIAVIYEEKHLTYSQVKETSDAIAAYIEGLSMGRGDVVSILIPRGEYQVVASLGALKAGCAYQPLDYTYPVERLNFMVKDSSAKLLITSKELRANITDYDGEVLLIEEIPQLPKKVPASRIKPSDTFILLYTSGSTGVPKGVRLTHANLVCFIANYKRLTGITPSDIVGQYASYGFDVCMMDMYPALSVGARTCIVPEKIRLNINDMNEYLIKNRVTIAFMTTQVGRQYAEEMENPYLRFFMVGGEKLASMEPPKGFDMYNGYGPTECTIFSTCYKLTKREDNIPIGRPIDNAKCYVADSFGHLLPAGAIGELIIAGPIVGDKYLNRPEKSAEVFIKNPFDGGKYENAYKTGDIVRYRMDGNIEFIGRRDGQVKIHGFRIELSEVEAVIRDFKGIREAAVVARDLGADGKAIAAYYVSDEKIDPIALADYIRSIKPPYMVPASLMQIDKIPLNQNGKVNKKALPEPVLSVSPEEEEGHIDNVLEKELKNIIGSAINMDNPPLGIALEYLGLSSLGMIRLSTKLYKRFGVNFDVSLLKDKSIRDLEDQILENYINGENPVKPAEEKEEESAMPLSAAQMGVYLDCAKKPESTSYNVPYVLCFDKSMDTERLKGALFDVLRAHPSIFVRFDINGNEVMAIKDKPEIPEIPVYEMTHDEAEGFEKNFVKPFHLARGPLFHIAIVKTDEDIRLFMDFHHLIFDGFSTDIFLKTLGECLGGKEQKKESSSYFRYVREQKERLAGERRGEYEDYFGSLLSDFESSTELTGDVRDSSIEPHKSYYHKFLDEALSKKATSRTGVSEAAFYLAALFYTLSRMTGSDNVYIATISSGRSDVRFSDTFGMFVNTIPLAASLSDGSVDEFIKETAKGFDKALSYEDYPFAELSAKWGYSAGIMYEYQRGIVEKPEIPLLKNIHGLDTGASKFGITVRIVDLDGRSAAEVEYNSAACSEELISDFVRSFEIVAEAFADKGRTRLRTISLIDSKREELLEKFRKREVWPEIQKDELFFSGMERTAKESPDKTAIIASDGTFTYREFDENSNRVANALIKLGAAKGDKVVLLLPRYAKTFFAIYGALKAGCAYIPCDPNYPTERIRHIIEDSGAEIIITTADKLLRFKEKKAVDIEELLGEENTEKPVVDISQDDLAYLIYTSGSTGKPKGVELCHRGIVNYFTNTPGNILINAMVERGHVLTAITTFSFDFSLKEWGAPLFNGLTLSVASDEECNDASALAGRMTDTGTDMFGCTPSRLMTLMESEGFKRALNKCDIVICGGEKYPQSLLRALKDGHEKRLIFNTYGPTETTVSSNTQELSSCGDINAGRPLPGVIEYVVDSDGNELPPNVVGELLIGGIGVAKGYNRLPDMTAEKFAYYRGGRVYKSGDFARWTPEGFIEILGRKDNQIKLRGLRIELGEVENVLTKAQGIERAVVKIEKINGIEHLCAYFTAESPVDIGELKKELSRQLTSYMVPTAYMQLSEMPMTPNGKLDLKNLPAPKLYRAKDQTKAEGAVEKDFSNIFSKLLHVEDVGADENFFDLGGTSLLVTNVVIEALAKGYGISFADVFDNPTPRLLAALCAKAGDKKERAAEEDDEITGFDYSGIDALLEKNSLKSFKEGKKKEIGTVLLTGATGYLGIHILNELLENTDSVVYALCRHTKDDTAQMRLQRLYFYYFAANPEKLMGERLFVIDGDVTDKESLGQLYKLGIDTVINCAAVVKHFSSTTLIEDVNVKGALNLIEFCEKTGAAMIQTSTMSVASTAYKDTVSESYVPKERKFYFGQNLDNKYVHSKFIAERAVLDAISKGKLRGKVMRFGNLAARHSDGEFQINFDSNSAMGRLKAYTMLGCASFDQLNGTMEFSPIDAVAQAVVRLCRTPDECVLFHVFNNQNITMEGIFHELSNLGYNISYVEREEFAKAFAAAQADPDKATLLTSMMAYVSAPGARETIRLERNCEYTLQVLYRLGFAWPVTTWDYIGRFVSALSGLGYFD